MSRGWVGWVLLSFVAAVVLASVPQKAFDRFADGSLPVLWRVSPRVDTLSEVVDRLEGVRIRSRIVRAQLEPGRVTVEVADPAEKGNGDSARIQDVYAVAYAFLVEASGIEEMQVRVLDGTGRVIKTYAADRPSFVHAPPPGSEAVPAFVHDRFVQR
ncbi:MAG: hypothetical protein QJR06_02385 [Alicyclobacillaceae bacterium]|nr:hypothetical protein [Alicyclobacillaceae bacterium]